MAKLAWPQSGYLLKPQSLLDRLGGNLLAMSHCLGVLCSCVCVAGEGGQVVNQCGGRHLSIDYLKEWIISNNLALI